jgi:hypothetical protein
LRFYLLTSKRKRDRPIQTKRHGIRFGNQTPEETRQLFNK